MVCSEATVPNGSILQLVDSHSTSFSTAELVVKGVFYVITQVFLLARFRICLIYYGIVKIAYLEISH
ncbi:hypothetical protein K450DRAFT_259016 [Umbelopsis ramanniana AG]|uniref:Uncharacterized protein n=1 Tax=Umbelopsis ramanniana AG TaxID=1314678 RepID=A0AAD5E5J6_UMBRA|nr:uncharacterized protein K450DRAFT_259016 [Umbelopsis ramanniana AG]KAI8576025.1 hypothetical protein K450DRAFT_259016 [Umbelopsis ramanniana AG]